MHIEFKLKKLYRRNFTQEKFFYSSAARDASKMYLDQNKMRYILLKCTKFCRLCKLDLP